MIVWMFLGGFLSEVRLSLTLRTNPLIPDVDLVLLVEVVEALDEVSESIFDASFISGREDLLRTI